MIGFLIVALATLPGAEPVIDRVDLVEVNHFFDENGKRVFDQLLFYDRCGVDFEIRAWRLMKSDSQRPLRDWGGRKWVATFHDGDLLREVHSPLFRETWTQYDPELEARDKLPKEKRRGLLFEKKP